MSTTSTAACTLMSIVSTTTATNNPYVIGDVVWYLGNVYRCIANNDSILPTSTTYWTNLGAGNPLVAQPSDWNATSGNNQILNKPTIPDVSGFVPYTGATQDVDLGEYEIKAGQVEFDQTPTGTAGVGVMRWNDSDGTVDLGLKGGNVTLQIGQESALRVVNKTATNINLLEANYQAVRVTGAQGQRLKVDLAQATTDNLSAETIGLVTETINNNQEGFITTSGLVRNINTTGSLQGETWADGDILYLSPTTAGRVTKVKPVAPNHLVIVGYVVHAHANQGSIFVKVDNGYELDELHNVKITSAANNNVLAYTSATDIWENKTVETALGYTPQQQLVSGTNIKTINGASVLGSGDLVVGGTNIYSSDGSLTAARTLTLNSFPLTFSGTTSTLFYANGNIGVNQLTDGGFKFDVNGTARVQNVLTVNKGAGNFFTLDAAANGSNLELRFFKFGSFSASLSTREFTTVGGRSIGQGIGLNGGFLATTIGANAGIIAVSNTGGNAEMHIGSPAGFSSYVSFRENGVADRGVIGYQNGTSYFQIRVNGATSMTTGTMSTAFFNTGNVGINTTTDAGFKLDVNGTARFGTSGARLELGDFSGGGQSYGLLKADFASGWAFGISNLAKSQVYFEIRSTGQTIFGSGNTNYLSLSASAKVQIDSTTQGFLPPRMTTTQKNAISTPAAGLVVYDTTLGKLCVRTAAAWETITSI